MRYTFLNFIPSPNFLKQLKLSFHLNALARYLVQYVTVASYENVSCCEQILNR